MRFILFIFTILGVSSCATTETPEIPAVLAAEHGEAQVARFFRWTKVLKEALPPGVSAAAARKNLVAGENRAAAFNLQVLGQLYEKESKFFAELRRDFKDLHEAIVAAKKQPKTAGKKLEALLVKKDWLAKGEARKLDKTERLLVEYDWRSYEDDKATMLQALTHQLDKTGSTDFNLARLEQGNGIAELHRELRWFTTATKVLNGLVQYKPEGKCPVEAYGGLSDQAVASSPAAELEGSEYEIDPCLISRCLFLATVNLGDELAKAEAAPAAPRGKINLLYAQSKKTRLAVALADELKSCK